MTDAAYMRDYRARNKTVRERQAKVERARRRAMVALTRLHEHDYLVLLARFRLEEGLD